MNTTKILDVTGLQCPLPVLRANKALRGMADGEELCVQATDAAAPKDFEVFCQQAGHRLVASREEAGVYILIVRKGG